MTAAAIFDNKTFVLTGGLRKCTRDTAERKIKLLGGKVRNTVTSRTDYLIIADDNPKGNKYRKALELNYETLGKEIIFMTEKEFYKYANM